MLLRFIVACIIEPGSMEANRWAGGHWFRQRPFNACLSQTIRRFGSSDHNQPSPHLLSHDLIHHF
jgi:hypothetical protein